MARISHGGHSLKSITLARFRWHTKAKSLSVIQKKLSACSQCVDSVSRVRFHAPQGLPRLPTSSFNHDLENNQSELKLQLA